MTNTKNYKILLLLISIFLSGGLIAQTITTEPEFPVPTQAVTLTFDLSGTNLEGNTGELYLHTGVSIKGVGDWRYVIGQWGANADQPKLSKIAADLYEIEMTPSINEFYNVPSGEIVTAICLVVRSEDAQSQTSDIFISVYEEDGIQITAPDSTGIYSLEEEMPIHAVAIFATEMTLYINDTEITTVTDYELNYNYVPTQSGKNNLRIEATDGTQTVEETLSFFVREANIIADLPNPNLKDGINYIDDNTVTLVIYAPYKEFIFVKGSFNNWEITHENQMNITPDGNRFWITLNNLTAGKEYVFQYIIDGIITIADPYSEKILDPWNDQYISQSTYPDLIQYPHQYTKGIASVFQTAQEPYTWQTNDFTPPNPEDLIIYELLVRDFVAAHDYTTLIDTLNYLKTLGVNAIELMPVNEFEENSSWGYNPSFYFAPDKYYGPKNDLKAFIDSCHANGIAVIFDIVLNHSFNSSPFVQMYFDPNAGDWGKPTPESPWFLVDCPHEPWCWGNTFDQDSPETHKLFNRVTEHWLNEYRFDGFRFDFTKGFTNQQTGGQGWTYDQARIDNLKRIADHVWTVNPHAYVILEHFTENTEEKELAEYGMLLWGNLTHAYAQAAMGHSNDWDFSWASHKERNWNSPHLIAYMESHDEERMMYRNLNWGNSSGSYDITEKETALERVKLATLFFLSIPGPKMIWQFGELGYDYSINHCPDGTIDNGCRTSEKPIRWDYLDEPDRYALYQFFGKLINLRKEYDIFKTNEFSINAGGAIKEITLSGDTMDIHIIGNFDVQSKSVVPTFSTHGTWYEYFSGEQITTPVSFNLQAGEYRLYTNKQMPEFEYSVPPEASDVEFSGNLIVGDTLYASYTYYDPNGDPEAESVLQWYTAAAGNGAGTEAISGANKLYYVLTENETDKYIAFGVTPVANSETNSIGKQVISDYDGPVTGTHDELTIFPNPISGNELNIAGQEEYNRLIIYDLYGHKMYETELPQTPTNTIQILQLQSGLYIIKFIGENGTQAQKISVQNN